MVREHNFSLMKPIHSCEKIFLLTKTMPRFADEIKKSKKKKAKDAGEESGFPSGPRANFTFENTDRGKPISGINQPAGSYVSRDNTSGETKVVSLCYPEFSLETCNIYIFFPSHFPIMYIIEARFLYCRRRWK